MSNFDKIPNKQLAEKTETRLDVWPELGSNFELNQFYKLYLSSEGWLGEGYLIVWTPQEIVSFRAPTLKAYPEKYHFFASDGGGTQFGFAVIDGSVLFVSAPNIGDEEDIHTLGNWEHFLSSVESGDYI